MSRVAAVLAVATVLAVPFSAAARDATTLDALLEQVREGWRAEAELDQQREDEFRTAKDQQKRLLDEALARREAARVRSEQLEEQFEQGEHDLTEAQETLRERMGTLGELFGVVRQVAGDTKGVVDTSLISAQLPGRSELLDELAQSRELPSVRDLERLWFAIQQEMTESGKVVRFPGKVVGADGQERASDVVRVGPFTAFSRGEYLQYSSESGKLVELARQPASRHSRTLPAFEKAPSGLARVAIDPARGSILALLVQTSTTEERFHQGGPIGYITVILGIIAILIGIERIVQLGLTGRRMQAQAGSTTPDANNPLGRVLKVHAEHRNVDVETLELKLDEAILKEVPKLERGVSMIKVISVVAPLLGLLGTVTGMIKTFEVITLFGSGDPKLMAGGISEALVTTVLGLMVAIPLTLLHSFVSGRSQALIQILEEQAAGIVAARAEEQQVEGQRAVAA